MIQVDCSFEELGEPPRFGEWLMTKLPEGFAGGVELTDEVGALVLWGVVLLALVDESAFEFELCLSPLDLTVATGLATGIVLIVFLE